MGETDSISRQAALDELKRISFSHWFECGEYLSEDTREIEIISSSKALEVIEALPSTRPERKTGKWVKAGGYATPGGDPVWVCSECGKGLHVYGIEHGTYGKDVADGQWVACPNCGARMEE